MCPVSLLIKFCQDTMKCILMTMEFYKKIYSFKFPVSTLLGYIDRLTCLQTFFLQIFCSFKILWKYFLYIHPLLSQILWHFYFKYTWNILNLPKTEVNISPLDAVLWISSCLFERTSSLMKNVFNLFVFFHRPHFTDLYFDHSSIFLIFFTFLSIYKRKV